MATTESEAEGDAASRAPSVDEAVRAGSEGRPALYVFVALVLIAFPLVLFGLGSYHWFFRDDFFFITTRHAGSLSDLFRPHDSHWSTIPVVVFRLLWKAVGFRSYKPYQAVVLALHLTAAVLLRVVMRRAGVRPWLATAAAALFVLFGAGSEDIIWAFQIGFTASFVFGLTQLILSDHDGPLDRRDGLGIASGILGLMCSGIGVVMAVVVGIAVLLRRGWKAAMVVTVPLAAAYGIYWLAERPRAESPFGNPTIPIVLRWVRSSQIGAFRALGQYPVVSIALAALLVVGMTLALVAGRRDAVRGRLAVTLALLVGGLVFAVLTAEGRWFLGERGARAGRYVYLSAAFVLPALAVAADALSRRWRVLTPLLALLFVVAIPANIGLFDAPPFGPVYFATEKRILTTVVRMPFAAHVPSDTRPIPDVFLSKSLTIGFLLHAARTGRLPVSTGPVPPEEVNEYRIRLGVAQDTTTTKPEGCRAIHGSLDLSPTKRTVFQFLTPMSIATLSGDRLTSTPIAFNPGNGSQLTITMSDLHLRLIPPNRTGVLVLCNGP